MSSDKPTEILLVEDNPADVRLISEAFAATDRETSLRTATDGYEALRSLKRQAAVESKTLPDLALIDLNLPGKNGCDLLESIRDDPNLRCLPVIILTSSDDDADIVRCYQATANAYLTKPTTHEEFVSLIDALEQFWCEQVRFPPIPQ